VPDSDQVVQRRWIFYTSPAGNSPVEDFLADRSMAERAKITARMERISTGHGKGRHLRDEIFEVKIPFGKSEYRVLYASVGERNTILLALEAFTKKTRKTPLNRIESAEKRLKEWLTNN
jgi:phage-related protein